MFIPPRPGRSRPLNVGSGVWGTVALWRDLVIADTDEGKVLGIDRVTGAVRWSFFLTGPLWQSPVVVEDVLLLGDCAGVLHAYDLAGGAAAPGPPPERWQVALGGCIESTPAVWEGSIFVGTRAGAVHALW
ncbi:MAG: PQQ-binding-like beta-propeller repeat protein [Acidimicrobiia bacterium]|nr:PQQ-binding-like beta-propeller repeat protein [Acidimicrobiia bacterium]